MEKYDELESEQGKAAALLRGTGRSTKQMLTAPIGAVYIINSVAAKSYFVELAHHIGRIDLDIKPVSQLPFLRGRELSAIVYDHDVDKSKRIDLPTSQLSMIEEAKRWLSPRSPKR